jgi:hypothetical protein
MVSSLSNEAWLPWMERLVAGSSPDSFGEELPRSRFYCRLDDQPDHLTPKHSLRHWAALSANQQLMVNPGCFFTSDGEFPQSAGDPAALPNFAWRHQLVWVREPGSETLLPFWLGPRLHHLVAQLKPGDAAPEDLSSETEFLLRIAGVLVPEDWVALRQRKWLAGSSQGAEAFRRNGYVPMPYLLHPFQIAALRRYYRYMIRNGGMEYGDCQSAHRYFIHNESVARFLHSQLTATVAALTGEPVKPSYAFVASYNHGATLNKHVDREQCEFSISLCIDYSPEPRDSTPWPLLLHPLRGKTTVFQALGDGLLYRGRQLPHSRDPLPPGHTSTSIFLHYVPQAFTGPLV